jgi:hypothetical protein
MMNEIATAAGSGAKILIYAGAQPSGGGSAAGNTLLGELSISGAFAGAATSGVLTLNATTQDSSANASGTATWFRVTTSADVWVFDGDISGTGGNGDLIIDNTAIILNGTISMSGVNTLTAPNAQ